MLEGGHTRSMCTSCLPLLRHLPPPDRATEASGCCWDRSGCLLHAVLWLTTCLPACPLLPVLQKYRDAAMIELEALNTLSANDPAQSRHCVQLLEWFDYRWVTGWRVWMLAREV